MHGKCVNNKKQRIQKEREMCVHKNTAEWNNIEKRSEEQEQEQ